jgi:Uma2 family endonuclease
MLLNPSTSETMGTSVTTTDAERPKRTSPNKLDKYEIDYVKERQKPMPSKLHSHIQGNLNFELRSLYGKKYRVFSELSLELPTGKPTPDLCLYELGTLDLSYDEVRVKIPPLAVFEILSPKQSINDIKEKYKNIYLPAGIQSVWLVIPELNIVALGLPNGQFETIKTDTVKDLHLDIELSIQDIFK